MSCFIWLYLFTAMIVLLLFLAKRHKKSTEQERAKLYQSRKKTHKITDDDRMLSGAYMMSNWIK